MPDDSGNPTFPEVVSKLRARLLDAKSLSIGEDAPQDYALGMIMQLMGECEKQRQVCLREMQSHREQARAAEYQASAFGMVHSMAWAVYDGFIKAQEKSIEEEKAKAEEKAKEVVAPAKEEVKVEEKKVVKLDVKQETKKTAGSK